MRVLYILSHHDDEYGCVPLIRKFAAQGAEQHFVFMTACGDTPLAHRRQAESKAFLAHLGIQNADCTFLGFDQSVETYKLHERLGAARKALHSLLSDHASPDVIVTHAWEGGHVDHDVCHALVCELLRLFPESKGFQIPLYHMLNRRWPIFQSASPLPDNGVVLRLSLSHAEWRNYLLLARHFESQWRVLLVLLPVMFASFAMHGYRYQRIERDRCRTRPHLGPLMYEQTSALRFEVLSKILQRELD